MTSDNIITVNESDFSEEVLAYSQNVPVLVDFWAEWCAPCKILGPILEKLAKEGQGSFRLAKLDVDFNKNIAIRYGIRSIPAVKAFMKGQVVAEFTGVQTEIKVREFLRTIAPSPADLLLEKGTSLAAEKKWQEAESVFREALQLDSGMAPALIGLVRCLLAQSKTGESLQILKHFPASHDYSNAQLLIPLAEMIHAADEQIDCETPLEAAMWNSIRLAKRGRFPAAIDGLLDILRQQKNFKGGLVRQLILALLFILGDQDPDTRSYRTELASILF